MKKSSVLPADFTGIEYRSSSAEGFSPRCHDPEVPFRAAEDPFICNRSLKVPPENPGNIGYSKSGPREGFAVGDEIEGRRVLLEVQDSLSGPWFFQQKGNCLVCFILQDLLIRACYRDLKADLSAAAVFRDIKKAVSSRGTGLLISSIRLSGFISSGS